MNKLNTRATEIATSLCISESDDNWIETYTKLVDATDGSVPTTVTPWIALELYTSTDLVEEIHRLRDIIIENSSLMFEYAKKAIIDKSINCEMSGDMNELDFYELIEHGLSLTMKRD